jgi:hypothetical protein
MSHSNNDQGILRVIQSIASNRESGELEIISSRNLGTLRFSKGKLIDATLGMLSGFQAINAAISLRDVQLSFKPLTSAPRPGSIAPNERRVLQSFFGIEAADETDNVVGPPIDWNANPHQVVPLSEVDEGDPSDLQDTPTIEVKPVVLPEVEEALAEPAVVRNEIPAESISQSETRFVGEEPIPKMLTAQAEPENINGQEFLLPQSHRARRGRAEFLRRMPIAAVVLLLVIAAAAAITLIPKLSKHRELASVPSTAAEQPSTDAQATTPEANQASAPNIRQPLEQAHSKSQTIPAPQATTPDSSQASVPNTRQPAEQTPSKSPTTPGAQQQTEASQTSPPLVAANRRPAFPKHEVDLTGEWHVVNTVDQTAYRSFQDMQIGFRLKIEQNGKDFTATGEKVSENGRPLPARSRTPIHVTGSIDGDNVVATFVEDGRARRTNGRFAWRLQDENAGLTGTFVTGAAKSSGKSAATREQ